MGYHLFVKPKKKIQINLFTKQRQIHRYRKQVYGAKEEDGQGKDKLDVWDQQIQTTVYKIHKQGATIQHRNYIQSLVINYYEKEYIYILLCCTPVTNTIQQINSTSMRNKTLVFGKFDTISLSILTILCCLSVTDLSL